MSPKFVSKRLSSAQKESAHSFLALSEDKVAVLYQELSIRHMSDRMDRIAAERSGEWRLQIRGNLRSYRGAKDYGTPNDFRAEIHRVTVTDWSLDKYLSYGTPRWSWPKVLAYNERRRN